MAYSPIHFSQERSEPETNRRCRTLTKTARSRVNPTLRPSSRPFATAPSPSPSHNRQNSSGPPMRMQGRAHASAGLARRCARPLRRDTAEPARSPVALEPGRPAEARSSRIARQTNSPHTPPPSNLALRTPAVFGGWILPMGLSCDPFGRSEATCAASCGEQAWISPTRTSSGASTSALAIPRSTRRDLTGAASPSGLSILPHRIGPPLGLGLRRSDHGKEALQAGGDR